MTLSRLERLPVKMDRAPALESGITIGDFLVPIPIGERMGTRVRHLALVLAGALAIYLGARLAIPVPGSPVPITGQTLGVVVVGSALGFRRGILATLVYLLVGVIGIPAFAEGRAGVATIVGEQDGHLVLGATGGYLVGFVLAAAIVGRLAELGWDRHLGGSIAAMAIGNLAIYLVALPWLAAAASLSAGDAIAKGLLPFLVGDALKIAIAAGIFPIAWWLIGRRPEDR